ncbi:uncharacterized protein LOC143877562 isoform X4 [Tasmannia lanceolata]|uniref:uncharacterized protein LOC143877562 isoform X4 n=1 Tax=Tasmannia lanceolata TaxID=3420 RepID=UPI004062B986
MDRGKILDLLFLLFLGQIISLFLAVTSFTSSLLSNLGVDTPLTQSLFTYLSLALVFGSILLYRRQKLRISWYWYAVLAFVDVQANYLVIKAYQFSSITSVTLLDCWTVPWAIILTWIFIGTRYSLWQLLGAATCVVGLGLVLLSDAGVSGGGGNKPLLGDSLVIAGTFFYAISNVGEISLFVGFAMSTFLFYTIAPFVLKMGGATIFNLSLLTSDMWVVLIRIFFYGQQVDWLYYFSFVVVALGLIIYSLTSSNPATAVGDEEVNGCYEQLNEENAESRNEVQTTERGTSES